MVNSFGHDVGTVSYLSYTVPRQDSRRQFTSIKLLSPFFRQHVLLESAEDGTNQWESPIVRRLIKVVKHRSILFREYTWDGTIMFHNV